MRRKVMELVDNVKTKMTDQEYIEFCALLKKNEAYEPVNLEGATLVKIKFNHIEVNERFCDCEGEGPELNVKEYTNIVQVVEEDKELCTATLLFRGIVWRKRLGHFVEQINWRKKGTNGRNICYGVCRGDCEGFNEWIEPLEIEVLSRDKQFSK